MRTRTLLLPALVLFAHRSAAGQAPSDPTYQQVFDELRNTTPRGDRVAVAHHLLLQRDAMQFRLEDGKIYLLSPVAGQTPGAVFVGTGSIAFAPPLAVERAHMAHVLGDSVLDAPISAAVLLFADSTQAELERQLTFGTDNVAGAATAAVRDALDRLIDGGTRQTEGTLMTALLNRVANGYFHGYLKRPKGEDLMFEVDPFQEEAIGLLRRGRLGRKVQTVCRFPRASDLGDTTTAPEPPPGPITVTRYDIESTIEAALGFSATATLHFTANQPGVRWTRLLLFSDLEVDSILDATGRRDSFFRAKSSPELWVRFATPLNAGQADSIRIGYHGRLIANGSLMEAFAPELTDPRNRMAPPALDSWSFIKSTELWFPRTDWRASDVTLTFHTPNRYQFASVGRLVDSRVDGSVRTTRWATERPTSQISFNIGLFREFQVTDPRIPPVLVQVNAEAHARLDKLVLQPRDPEVVVGGDVANSLAFFTQVFGPPLFSHYYATEIPYGHGQAFPGLIHLSWYTFQSVDESGFNEIFRAHEMAHQWWGIGVEPADYRDVWLSEGFSDFAGLWYMQQVLKDNTKFFRQLEEWRKDIRSRREGAAPIALGSRVAEDDPGDYQIIVYEKGAWVLQMLRNLMLDLRTMSEDAFTTMMQDFYRQYRGRRASTRDFQRVVEQHAGGPMAWFFNQWVYGTGLPTYVVSWKSESAPDQHYILHLRVRQENVPADFVMPVPVLIQFADNTHALVRVVVRGPLTEKDLRLPAEPSRVEVNALSSVLADVRTEAWH